jgi:hypothetical protein
MVGMSGAMEILDHKKAVRMFEIISLCFVFWNNDNYSYNDDRN